MLPGAYGPVEILPHCKAEWQPQHEYTPELYSRSSAVHHEAECKGLVHKMQHASIMDHMRLIPSYRSMNQWMCDILVTFDFDRKASCVKMVCSPSCIVDISSG